MCNNYASHVPANLIAEAFSDTGFPLRFDGGVIPNLEPRDDIRIGDTASIVTRAEDGPLMRQMTWAWKSPQGRPVFNFRSDGRSFGGSDRCLIPADAFYEFTAAEPGQKRKTKWRFTVAGEPWFWIAGIIRNDAWAMLTTEPGEDIRPYAFRNACLLMSLEAAQALPAADVPTSDAGALFAWIVGRGGNAALSRAFQTVELHLGRLARTERRILGDPADVIAGVAEAILHDRRLEAAEMIAAYHRTRMTLAAGARTARCDPRCPAFIDHIAAGTDAAARIAPASFEEYVYGGDGERPSDDCPVSVRISG